MSSLLRMPKSMVLPDGEFVRHRFEVDRFGGDALLFCLGIGLMLK